MSKNFSANKRLLSRVLLSAAVFVSAGGAQAATPFEVDVSTAINRGIEFLATQGVYNNPSSVGDDGASGLAMEALLEKRASGIPTDPPQGYIGATATDQGRLRTAAAYILDRVNNTSFYAYRDGQWMFALSSYALTGGPDKSTLAPANASYQTIKQAMDSLVDRTIAAQRKAPGFPNAINQGYWCYTNEFCEDSSTTQFAVAGLAAAKSFYSSNKSADDPFADAARVTAIDAALARSRTAYELNAAAGSDNASCFNLSANERGHGYNSFLTSGYRPSLAQTSSGIYIQLFGGANINTPMVQSYMQWVKNRYRWEDLDNLGNFWSGNSMGYYMWSSFKAMELLRQAGVPPSAGNIGANEFGTLPAASAPACVVRQENKEPATFARPAVFGAGAVGYYAGEPKGQYFDYAHQLISMQCANGSFTCTGFPGSWGDSFNTSHNSYALLVLQRSTGGGCVDTDGDGVCDDVDNCPAVANANQANTYGDARGDACEPRPVATCDIDVDSDVDTIDVNLVRAGIGKPLVAGDKRDVNGDGKITINDVRACTLKCTRANCATN